MHFLNTLAGQVAISVGLLSLLAPLVIWFFRDTWASLDAAAATQRQRRGRSVDPRTPVTFLVAICCLLSINYFGCRDFFERCVIPLLKAYAASHPGTLDLGLYGDLYWRIYWGLSRYLFYLLPLGIWPLVFRENPLDLGLRVRGFFDHAWLYLLCVVVVIPALAVAAHLSDFSRYYPMYPYASRSWLDFWVWEMVYIGQFFTLEVFFRGFWLRGARGLGCGAIFSMLGPYVMIHFTKPYLEACGALVAGTVLGSLSMKTRSIWAGFLVHSTVAVLMDLVALDHRNAMPTRGRPGAPAGLAFPHMQMALWAVWTLALVALLWSLWRKRRRSQSQPAGNCDETGLERAAS